MTKRLIRIKDIVQRTSISRSQIYLLAKSSDFPKPIKLGTSSFWILSEVDEWIDTKISLSRGNEDE